MKTPIAVHTSLHRRWGWTPTVVKDVLSRNDTYIFKKSVAWVNATLRFSVTCRNYGISNPEAFNRGFRLPQTVNSLHLGRGLDHQRFNNPPAVVYGRIILIPHMTLIN